MSTSLKSARVATPANRPHRIVVVVVTALIAIGAGFTIGEMLVVRPAVVAPADPQVSGTGQDKAESSEKQSGGAGLDGYSSRNDPESYPSELDYLLNVIERANARDAQASRVR